MSTFFLWKNLPAFNLTLINPNIDYIKYLINKRLTFKLFIVI